MDRLTNTVRRYAWGSTTALPALTGAEPDGTPQAELWMGAHPTAPSLVERGDGPRSLGAVIEEAPGAELGEAVLRRFGPRLPFLLKLLAAEAPLSLQVHPDLAQAAAGHARENARGIPLDAPHRTYPDANHKPEMIVALGAFDGLCGFRTAAGCADLLGALRVARLDRHRVALRALPEEAALRQVFSAFLTPHRSLVAEVTRAVAREAARPGPFREEFAAYETIARAHPGDAGLLPALMLNHVRLAPGEGLFLGAGVPHAYIRGLGVEVMAGSDNVLRCGLTSKHVDTAELLRVIRFAATEVRVERPVAVTGGEEVYACAVDDFRLSVVRPGAHRPEVALDAAAPQILVCTSGTVRVTGADGSLDLPAGASAYAPAGEPLTVSGSGTAYRATVDIAFP